MMDQLRVSSSIRAIGKYDCDIENCDMRILDIQGGGDFTNLG